MNRIAALLLCSTMTASAAGPAPWLPPDSITGATHATVPLTTLCKVGYTKTIRPPEAYTDALKKRQIKQFGYADTNPRHYEEDHLISLELGGHPTSPKNLWPEPYLGKCNAHVKDDLEDTLHKMVCAKKITLQEAQAEIVANWVDAYNKYIGELTCD